MVSTNQTLFSRTLILVGLNKARLVVGVVVNIYHVKFDGIQVIYKYIKVYSYDVN
jgi:hypothetical protein